MEGEWRDGDTEEDIWAGRQGRVERTGRLEVVGGDRQERNGGINEADADSMDSGETVRKV